MPRKKTSAKDSYALSPRIIRSPWSDFWNAEIETALSAYPDEYLAAIAGQGYNGIWLHCRLREAVSTTLFGKVDGEAVDVYSRLVERAGRHGIKLYVFMNEPHALSSDDPFWKKHPDLAGQPLTFDVGCGNEGRYVALCTSTPEVRTFLEEGCHNLFSKVRGLGGVILITASEAHSHCYSHYPVGQKRYSDPNIQAWTHATFECDRCVERRPTEVVAEIIRTIRKGIRSVSREADIIAWTWSWYILERDPQEDLIGRLPKDVMLLADWERGGTKNVCGQRHPVDEYSFSYAGPSPRFKNRQAVARRNGLRMLAKLQIGATHELVTVPYMPLPTLLARKMERLHERKVDGYLGCWIFGGAASPMSRLAGIMSRREDISADQAVRELAKSEFGSDAAGVVVRAWNRFGNAWKKYPVSISFLYYGPMNYAVAHPLSLEARKTLRIPSHLPLPRDRRGRLQLGDSLDAWLEPFDAATVVGALKALVDEWRKGVAILEAALTDHPENRALALEHNLARYVELTTRSTINVIRFHVALRKLRKTASDAVRTREREKIKRVLQDERDIARAARDVVRFDPRLGYHPEAFCHQFTVEDLDRKIRQLSATLRGIERD